MRHPDRVILQAAELQLIIEKGLGRIHARRIALVFHRYAERDGKVGTLGTAQGIGTPCVAARSELRIKINRIGDVVFPRHIDAHARFFERLVHIDRLTEKI